MPADTAKRKNQPTHLCQATGKAAPSAFNGLFVRCGPDAVDHYEYYKSLDKALIAYITGDPVPFAKHCENFKVEGMPSDPVAYKCAVMKTIANRSPFPAEFRDKAIAWLKERDFSTSLS